MSSTGALDVPPGNDCPSAAARLRPASSASWNFQNIDGSNAAFGNIARKLRFAPAPKERVPVLEMLLAGIPCDITFIRLVLLLCAEQ